MDQMEIVLGNVKKIKENNSDEPGVLEEMQSANSFLQQILFKGIKEKGEIYENQKMLTDTYIDITLLTLCSINNNIQDIKPITCYKFLKELPVFDNLEENLEILLIKNEDDK